MAHESTHSRFERLSREILTGSYPYGFDPGQPPPERFALALVCDYAPPVTIVVACTPEHQEVAMTFRNCDTRLVDRVTADFDTFRREMQLGEFGEMVAFSFLPRRVALRRLKRLINAN